ncbi:MAG TPA: hypothetical protein VGZ03_01545 [Acidimicrobiales bacterium]|nr:hypothetical protein [Acidimicrobiales bacterium]
MRILVVVPMAEMGKPLSVRLDDVGDLLAQLAGTRRTQRQGLVEWRYHGRLVARQLDATHLVVRAEFDARDRMLERHPGTFSVPPRFAKHMMVVADLERGDPAAIEDALAAAWELQRRAE